MPSVAVCVSDEEYCDNCTLGLRHDTTVKKVVGDGDIDISAAIHHCFKKETLAFLRL